jgi:peptide/nickel transport system substrate-binding protein
MGLIRLAALVLLALFFSPGAKANIVVGLGGSVTSLDPHFHNNSSNGNIAEHIFDALVARGDDTRIMPALATSWKLRGDSQWEFKLRPGVTFHDGSPFTADDVLFSLARTKTIKHSPSPYTIYTKAIQRVVAVDKLTIHIFTDGPAPQLLNDLAAVSIVSKRAAEHATTDDFNAGKALVGTGPFKFAAVWRNERIDLIRHDGYWGRKPLTARATILLLQNDAARTAALLAGRADVIGSVPPQDVKIIAANPAFSISKGPSFRLMYLHLDSTRKQTPFATAMDGSALATNPLRDQRVRRAISKAINRQAIVSKGLEGMGEPSCVRKIRTSPTPGVCWPPPATRTASG